MAARTIVVGAGIGGLMAAAELALAGMPVMVVEAAATPGGKMRRAMVGPWPMDVGPTVLTLRHVFDDLFARAGQHLDEHVTLRAQPLLARHFWPDGRTLDLYADVNRSSDAIGHAFGMEAATGYRSYAAYAQNLFNTAREPFIYAARPSIANALWHFGRRVFTAAKEMDAGRTMDEALQAFFPHTPELRQLFGRYATYTGASPHQAPATLHLISHVERMGVWSVVGGLSRLALALAKLIESLGGTLRYNAPVAAVLRSGGRARGVRLVNGEELSAAAVVVNADIRAVEADTLWPEDVAAVAPEPDAEGLSALIFALVGQTRGEALVGHNVLFRAGGGAAEFAALTEHRTMVADPSIYVYALDRAENDEGVLGGQERLFCLINAPAGMGPLDEEARARWQQMLMQRFARAGVDVTLSEAPLVREPMDFARDFYGSAGALYGRPPLGWRGFFARPGSRSNTAGMYLAGGGVHPGAGVPMAALSGQLAARAVLADVHSRRQLFRGGTRGGIWTPPATTANTH